MAEVGPRWAADTRGHIRLMLDRFSEILVTSPKSGVRVEKAIAYGAHERQCVDLFAPAGQARQRPGLIFVHGGAFTEGSRNRTDEVYANVLYYFARHGIVGINAGYRLAPEAAYPAASRDVGEVVAWMRTNAEALGVDASRIFLMGHSAGGAHVGTYAYDKRHHPAEGPGIAGLIVVSGRVRADNRAENPNARRVEAYYGTDPARYEDVSAEEFDRTLAINLRAPFLLAQAVLPSMRSRGYGRVFFMSSVAGFTGGVVGPDYAASKAGLHGLVHFLASRCAQDGVTVNALAPALIRTAMLPGDASELEASIPVGRLGTTEEVAELTLAMLANGYLTNEVVGLDGGLYPR